MKLTHKNYIISKCICPKCQFSMTVPRMNGNKRKDGHKKDMWCPICKDIRTMIEVGEY